MARIEPKKVACETGAAPMALERWLRFAPRKIHCVEFDISGCLN